MLKLGLIDSGPTAAADWQAAADRLADVTIVDADAADAVLVAGVDAANQAATAGRHVLLVPGSLSSSAAAAGLAAPDGIVVMLAATGRFQPSIQEVAGRQFLRNGSLGPLGGTANSPLDARWPAGREDRLTWPIYSTWPTGCLARFPSDVYAVRRGESDSYIHVHLGFPGGGMTLIDVATTSARRRGLLLRCR